MPRKTVKQQKEKRNRVAPVVKNFIGTERPSDIMRKLIEVLTESNTPPLPGKYYIFNYNAKTPNIRYDENPFVYVKNVYNWGFSGLNYHWGEERQYTWEEITNGIRGLYEIYSTEVSDVRKLSFGNIRNK